jgi:hypothetical protein
MRALIVLALFAASPACAASSDAPAMAQIVTGFYQAHQSTTQDGIPDAKTRARYAPYISSALDKLLAEGDAAEARFAKSNKDSPPLVEGDLFSPNFEGISAFRIGACESDAKGAHCKAMLHYADPHPRPQDKPVDWTDTVSLVNTPAGWRVDDIAYGGNWDFGNHGTLTGTLRSAIQDSGN